MSKRRPQNPYLTQDNTWNDNCEKSVGEVFEEDGLWFFSYEGECFGPYRNEFICRNNCLGRAVSPAPVDEDEDGIDWDDLMGDAVEDAPEPVVPHPQFALNQPAEVAPAPVEPVYPAGYPAWEPAIPKKKLVPNVPKPKKLNWANYIAKPVMKQNNG